MAQILIATALDEASDEVVSTGLEIARVLGARATLVHAFDPPFALTTELGPALGNEQYVQLEAERVREALAEQAARHGLGDARKLLSGSPGRALIEEVAEQKADLLIVGGGAALRCRVRTGNPREEILAEAASYRPDLLVLGTHGRGGFDRLVIGSVAADVVRRAPVSTLVVPPRAAVPESS
jgi:nucleotide-binding universal stress UspA family protein